jgi:hypothetical protein
VIHTDTGEVLSEHTIDPDRSYSIWPRGERAEAAIPPPRPLAE